MKLINVFRLTAREYFCDFLITPTLTAVLVTVSYMEGSITLRWWVWLAAGMSFWTFYEYATHRWVLHKLSVFREMHGLHHRDPQDYIAVPPAATMFLYFVFWLMFGLNSSAFMIGFSLGYITYSILHTLFHYDPLYSGPLKVLQRNHEVHHRHASMNFGVSSPLWDYVFDTYSPSTWRKVQ